MGCFLGLLAIAAIASGIFFPNVSAFGSLALWGALFGIIKTAGSMAKFKAADLLSNVEAKVVSDYGYFFLHPHASAGVGKGSAFWIFASLAMGGISLYKGEWYAAGATIMVIVICVHLAKCCDPLPYADRMNANDSTRSEESLAIRSAYEKIWGSP